jgi:hypothetical protein
MTTQTELQALSRDDIISELPELGVGSFKPNYNIVFDKDGKQIGELDFNGDKMVFRGEADKSAKVFFDYLAQYFAQRLQDERNAGLKEAADIIEAQEGMSGWKRRILTAIRARIKGNEIMGGGE